MRNTVKISLLGFFSVLSIFYSGYLAGSSRSTAYNTFNTQARLVSPQPGDPTPYIDPKLTPVPDCYCGDDGRWTQACEFPFAGVKCGEDPPCVCDTSVTPNVWKGFCGPSWGQSCQIGDVAPTIAKSRVTIAPSAPIPSSSVVPSTIVSYTPQSPSPTLIPTAIKIPTVVTTLVPSITAGIPTSIPTSAPTTIPTDPVITQPATTQTRINSQLQQLDINGNCVIDTGDFFNSIKNFGRQILVHNNNVKVSVAYLSLMLGNLTTQVCQQ